MPNHVTNILTLSGDAAEVKKAMEAIKYDKVGVGSIDFNKIIPMPPSLNIECGSRTEKGLKLYSEFIRDSGLPQTAEKYQKLQEDDPEMWALGKQTYENVQEHGCMGWYDFALNHWGTKWNSYGYDEDFQPQEDNKIIFQTAWSKPTPVIGKLSEMFPDLEINHRWADEDLGYNCGEAEYKNGEVIFENIPDFGSKEAYELAAEVIGLDLAEEGLVLSEDGSIYEYNEDMDGQQMT